VDKTILAQEAKPVSRAWMFVCKVACVLAFVANAFIMYMWAIFGLAAAGKEHPEVTSVILNAALVGLVVPLIVSVLLFRRQRGVLAALAPFLMSPIAFGICTLFIKHP
jgi:hypothetical protein